MSRCFIDMENGELVNVEMVGGSTGSGEDSAEITE
jgi:hypothetical protein